MSEKELHNSFEVLRNIIDALENKKFFSKK